MFMYEGIHFELSQFILQQDFIYFNLYIYFTTIR